MWAANKMQLSNRGWSGLYYVQIKHLWLFHSECLGVDIQLHIIGFSVVENMFEVLQGNVSRYEINFKDVGSDTFQVNFKYLNLPVWANLYGFTLYRFVMYLY